MAHAIEQDHLALVAFMRGDPEPKKRLYSRAEDATLANPLGPPARGWDEVSRRLEEASSTLRDGGSLDFERISTFAADTLGYTIDIERYNQVRVAGSSELRDFALRVTTIFRLDDDGWRIVHRHADSITSPRSIQTALDE
jgi:ketosteroid isomerase-like protein